MTAPAFVASATALHHLTAAEAGRLIARRALSPVELTRAVLDRQAAVDARIASFILVTPEAALADARRAEAEIMAGRWRGPLHGIPFAVKDNYDAAGLPRTAGSRLQGKRVAAKDATLVARMKAAGAVLTGKLSTWEYGTGNGAEYFDLPFPPARNPWDPARFPGGSSTGAGSAVAAGTVTLALGSDTTGSVRLPAAASGVVGLKSTQGRLSKAGLLANCYSMDVPGPLTWTVEDTAIVLAAIAGDDPADPTTLPVPVADYRAELGAGVAGLRIGVIRELGPGLGGPDAAMTKAFEAGLDVLAALGAHLVEAAFPAPVADYFALTRLIGPAESAEIHREELATRPQEMGFALRDKLLLGSTIRAVDYIAAQRRRRALADALDAVVSRFDALVTYGACHVAPRLDDEAAMVAYTADTAMTPFSLSSHPGLVQCTGFAAEGLPLHWQVVGRHFDEATVLRVAAAYEAATPWRSRRAEP